MRRLERYILAEIAGPFVVGVLLILVILLGDHLHKMLRVLITQDVGLVTVIRLLAFILPELTVVGIPLATILAVSVGINRLAVDREWSTMRTSGLSLGRMLVPVHLFGLTVALTTWLIGEHLAPAAKQEFDRTFSTLRLSNPALVVEPGRWLDTPAGDARFYVRRVDPRTNRLEELLILTDLQSDYPTTLTARQAWFDDDGFVMHDVIRHVWRPDGTLRSDSRTTTARVAIRRLTFEGLVTAGGLPDQMTSDQLRRQIEQQREQGLDPVSDTIALQLRYAAPVGCYLLALMCAPLALLTARRGPFAGLLIAATLVVVYFLSLQLGASLARSPAFEPFPTLGVWLQNLAFGLVAVVLYLWSARRA